MQIIYGTYFEKWGIRGIRECENLIIRNLNICKIYLIIILCATEISLQNYSALKQHINGRSVKTAIQIVNSLDIDSIMEWLEKIIYHSRMKIYRLNIVIDDSCLILYYYSYAKEDHWI